jgi:carbon-monoxide dehydrogenase large subunit
VKGIGDAGTIGSTPAVQNAVVDALSYLGIRHLDIPISPERVWAAIRQATAGAPADPWTDPPAALYADPPAGQALGDPEVEAEAATGI